DFRDAGGAPSGALDRGYASADASAPSAEETAEGAASPEPQLAQAQQSSFVKKGLLGLSAPVPTTQNGKSYRLRLLKADAAAPKLELFFARTDLGDVVSGVVFYLALLALPMLVLGGSRTGKLGGALLVLGAASLALAASEYLDTGTGSLASGLASGGAFLLVYALFRPIRWWLAPAALMLLVSMSPVDAATPDAPGPILFPYGEKTLGKALDNADWRGLMPAGMARLAEELSRQQGETTTALPPLAYTIALGKLAANVSGETAVFELTADIDVLQDGYQTVLLAEGAFAVGAFRGDGLLSVQGAKDYASQESTQNDEILQKLNQGREKIQVLAPQLSASVVLTGKGRHRCVLEVVKAKPFELRLPPMATCSAVVKFDREGVDADVVGGLKGKVTSKDGQTVLEADLASGGEFRVEGYEAAPAARPEPAPEEHHDSTAPSAPPAPATTAVRQPAEQKPYLLADVRTDLSVGEGLLKGFAVIDYLAHRGRVASLELSVPEGLRISRIQDMEGKELPVPKLAKAEAGFHAVSLPAPPGSHKKLKLTLQFERTLADGEKTFRVPLVRTRATEFESGSVTVQREGHVEVAASKLEGIEEVPPDRLAFGTTAATSLAFKYSSPGPALEFTVERHDETRLSTVAVDAASVRTEFSEGGGTVTHLELEVRRSSGQYLQLKLPPGAEIQRAQRDGSAVDVSRAQDGSPLLPLDATRGPDSPASKLEVEYRGPEVQLGFAGSFEYTLPSCQLLPVTGRGLSWSLQPPEGYRFYASNRGWTEGSDLLGLWRQPPADSGKAYLAGPSTASAVRVRYLKSVPALGVAVLHQGLFLLLGLGAAAVIYGGFPGGAGLGLLVFALAMVALAVLQAAYPARAAGVQALDLGLLAGLLGCLVRHWKLRIARRAATAAAVLLLAGSLQAAQLPASKAPFVFVRSADAAAVLTAGDWLFLPRRAIEQTLAVLEKQKESKEPEEHPTPDPVLAQSGETELRVGGEDAEAAATYRFVVLADGPHEVALGNPGSVSSLQVDGKPADVTAESPGGALRVYLRGKGNHTVSTVFRVPVTRVKDAGWLQWDQPRTPLDRVAVRLPGTGRGIEIVPSLSTSAREEGGETRATAVVRMAGSVFVRWFEKGEKTAETPKQKEEARFEAESATGFKLDGIKVSGHTELTYRVTRGALSGVTLAVPPGTDVLEVTGQAVKSWKAEGATVEVLFDRFRSDAGVLAIEHVRRQPPGSIVLAPPEARGASTHVSLVAVRADESTELRATDTGDLRPIDPEELPPSLRSEGIPLAFRGEEGRRALTLDVQRKKGIDTPLFDISRMKLDVIPGQAGWTASRMELTLRNNSRQHLEISLPEGAVPLDCKVQNEPRKPGQSKSGLLIPLVRSKGRPDTLEPFTLELTYLAQDGPPGGAVERWLLPLPIVRDAPVDRLEIGVTTPRGRALALWSEGLDQRGQPLPAERVAGAMQAVAILGNPLVWVGGALGVVTSFTGRQNVSTMLTRGGSSFDHGENGRYYPSSPRPAMEAEKGMATGGIGRMAKLRHAGKKARQRFERDRLKAGFTQERTDAPARAQKSLAGALPEPDAARELADDEREVSAPAPTSALAASGPMQAPSLGKDEAAADGSAVGGELYGNAAGGGGGGGGDEVADKKADAYQALQRSLGDRGSLPVGVKCNAEGASTIVFEGALYPAGGTPATLTLLVYDPSVRMLLDLGFGLLSFFLTLITLDWAIQLGHRSPFFLVATVLPMAGYALEWRLGEGTVLVIVCGLFLGMAGAAARQMER
ncbi:MAG: hypothetical protein HY303_11830, partial [Candidatus Wallbacteria bacterium]|nr:hypothetical protein [Candidatus Wallbacteria bacterium]